ncbi:hypothetical protein BJF78_29170 [Pseudonocardia sp. CNS-139]|nr:hypothetical protein BJF78_29170 [Pseudonocardia sp. CNS-139]
MDGSEERRVRAARRFGRIGLLLTTGWMLIVPAAVFWNGWPGLPLGPVVGALYLAALGLHLWRIRELVRSLGRPAPRWFLFVAPAAGLALTLVGLAGSPSGFLWAIISGVLLGDVVGGMSARRTAIWVVAATLAVAGLGIAVAGPAYGATPSAVFAGFAAAYVALMWTVDVERLWWLKAVTDLDDSRRTAAELATARERLRLADDLHDILGHALEVVAFKSELAARLHAADPDRAVAEMEEVQRVARQSLRDVRALVHDTRTTDLVTELAGARAVLGSAGVRLEVHGDPAAVGPAARTVFGRVLREAMTNVLRHAQPSRCTVVIEVAAGRARLQVVNDGVLLTGPDGLGTGLAALGRYLDDHAGRLDAGPGPDGTFRLDAVLPGAR